MAYAGKEGAEGSVEGGSVVGISAGVWPMEVSKVVAEKDARVRTMSRE